MAAYNRFCFLGGKSFSILPLNLEKLFPCKRSPIPRVALLCFVFVIPWYGEHSWVKWGHPEHYHHDLSLSYHTTLSLFSLFYSYWLGVGQVLVYILIFSLLSARLTWIGKRHVELYSMFSHFWRKFVWEYVMANKGVRLGSEWRADGRRRRPCS